MSSIITSTLICSISFLLIVAHVIAAQNVDEMDKTEFNPLVESQESQLNEHGDDKRATNTRNPYSWLN
uniref:Secreted protein n=1 Tax=Acrobeloides nanus TaxID=290746 RepID=A0A914D4L8_9BILA